MKNSEEIALVDLLSNMWGRRKFIAVITVVTLVVGLVVAFVSPVRYTAGAIIVPQTGQNLSGGTIIGLAAIAGLEVDPTQGELIPPMIYPMVASSIPFQKELMHSAHLIPPSANAPKREKWRENIPPGMENRTIPPPETDTIETLTPAENACRKKLSKILTVRFDQKNGCVVVRATMPEAVAAARVARRAQELLEQYVTRFKVQKAQADLDFVEARYRELKSDFEARQRAYAAFQDANRRLSSELARTRENSLRNEYELAFSIYSELARQREQASIKVKEDTPIFTVIEPVTVPVERSAPRRVFIMAVSLLAGLFIGAGAALVFPQKP
jgi:uncharacterized protein involved in exopolysaccharide biosynthesis